MCSQDGIAETLTGGRDRWHILTDVKMPSIILYIFVNQLFG